MAIQPIILKMEIQPEVEFIGVPSAHVVLKKKSQQFVAPPTEFDMGVDDFHSRGNQYSLRTTNILFVPDLGVAMVQPIFANRNNFIEDSVRPLPTRYFAEHPVPGQSESTEETERRVFIPRPTLHQFLAGSYFPDENKLADYKNPSEAWTKDWAYNGPEWTEVYHAPKGEGVTLPTSWLHQNSSAPNVEWFLQQKQKNFTNQSFWLDVHKYNQTATDADDSELFGTTSASTENDRSRYNRYGRRVDAYFAIRVGWYNPSFVGNTYPFVSNNRNKYSHNGRNGGYGPYDIVFPIGQTPFIWDHGSHAEFTAENADLADQSDSIGINGSFRHFGYVASEKQDTSWILSDDIDNFQIFVFVINGKLAIQTSFASGSWIFPDTISDKLSATTIGKYENFFVPPGNVCIEGRGFKCRLSYNPLEFNIYDSRGNLRVPSGRMISKPIAERREFPQDKKGGFIDYYNWEIGNYDPDDEQNFFCIPNGNVHASVEGAPEGYSYGFDLITDPPNGMIATNNHFGSHTSMMMGVNGAEPHSFINPPTSVVYTKFRGPEGPENFAPSVPTEAFGFVNTARRVNMNMSVMEIGLNCKRPDADPDAQNTSARFASPIVWRVKGRHVIPTPRAEDALVLDGLIKSINYESNSSELQEVRQTYKIEVIIPKSYEFSNYDVSNSISDRTELIDWLAKGVREVEVYLGWSGGTTLDPAIENPPFPYADARYFGTSPLVKVFTGLSVAGPVKETYGRDTITLECNDKLKILEDYPILNSPWYDGMSIDNAFRHICGLGGLPDTLFDVQSYYAHQEFLGVGYTFQKPSVRFDNGTTIFDAIKNVNKRFWHVVRTNPNGQIVLTDLNITSLRNGGIDITQLNVGRHAPLQELPLSDDSYEFFVDGSKAPNSFQRVYNSMSLNRNFTQRYTGIEITSIDRGDVNGHYAIIHDFISRDIDGVEDPDSPDFLGYIKPMRIADPAFGSREKIFQQRNNLANHVYEPPLQVTFTTFGRPTIRPYDIIQVNLPDEDDYAPYHTYLDREDSPKRQVKFRVLNVSGVMEIEDGMQFTTTVTAERI